MLKHSVVDSCHQTTEMSRMETPPPEPRPTVPPLLVRQTLLRRCATAGYRRSLRAPRKGLLIRRRVETESHLRSAHD